MTHKQFTELWNEIIAELTELNNNRINLIRKTGYPRGYGVAIRWAINIVTTHFFKYEKSVFLDDNTDTPPSLIAKQEFLKLPMDERRKILAKQAVELAAYYEQNRDIDGMGGGDFEDEKYRDENPHQDFSFLDKDK